MSEFGFFCSSIPFPPLTGFVPYVGATANLDMGAFSVTANSFIKTGGTSSQFLKADGSVDSSTYLTTASASATYVPYTGATTNVDLGAFSLTSPTIYGSSLASGTLTLQSTSNVTKGKILFGTSAYDEVNNRLGIGTTSPGVALDIIGTGSISNLLTCGQINAYTSNLGLYAKNANSSIFFGTNIGSNVLAQWNGISTSGAVTTFTFTTPANTNQTATTNIPNFRINGASKQWATGTVANQYWNYLTANTASFVGASTMTNSFGLYVEAATAGTNATITNNWAIGANGDIQIGGNQIVFSAATNAYLRNTVGNLRLSCASGARVAIDADGSLVGSFTSALTSITTTTLNLSGTTTIAGDTTINSAVGSSLTVTSAVRNAGVRTLFTLTGSADINQTSATEVNRILWTTGSKTWATGNITNQREFLITSPTYNFNGASTITNSYTMFVNAPIAGTNATITNNYALGLAGSLKINDTFNIVFDTTTGTKIATATTQKLAFWNATPIVQPTTAVAAAAFVSNTSLIANDTATFDGYTIGQIVKALRNTGLLA